MRTVTAPAGLRPPTRVRSRGHPDMQQMLLAFGLLPSVPPPRAGAIASAGRVALGPRMATEVNPSIAAATPCAFPWWSDECSALIAELDAKGGELSKYLTPTGRPGE